ncbi:MAG: signal peptidase II [Lentisphaeria bacterium]|nr:signal peptidase II [Lentisphaeria bacterium]
MVADDASRSHSGPSFWGLPAALCLAVCIVDQGTKILVTRAWEVNAQQAPLIPGFFRLVHFRNTGAAWGLFAGHPRFLGILSLVVLTGMIFFFKALNEGSRARALALGVICGGIVGNLVDRFAYGEVVDFLLFSYKGHYWPAFNVADSAICCGVGAYMLISTLGACGEKRKDTRKGDGEGEGKASPAPH